MTHHHLRRNDDPESSKDAARRLSQIRQSETFDFIEQVVRNSGPTGAGHGEIWQTDPKRYPRSQISKRCSELTALGRIAPTGEMRVWPRTDRKHQVYIIGDGIPLGTTTCECCGATTVDKPNEGRLRLDQLL